jgi:transposase
MEVTTIGLDIAMSVFQVHGIHANGNVIVRRQINVGMFWCSFRSWRRV